MSDLLEKYSRSYKKGDIIFTANDAGGIMYIIQTGKVKISIKAKKAEQILAILSKGDFFGEIALFTNRPRTATAMAMEDCTVLAINRMSMDSLLESNKSFAMNIIQKLCRRIQNANLKIEELLVISKDTRLLRELAKYWKINGEKEEEQLSVLKIDFIEYINSQAGITRDEAMEILNRLIELKQIKEDDKKEKIFFSAKIFYNHEF